MTTPASMLEEVRTLIGEQLQVPPPLCTHPPARCNTFRIRIRLRWLELHVLPTPQNALFCTDEVALCDLQPVSYKWLARKYGIPVNNAKQLLHVFLEQNRKIAKVRSACSASPAPHLLQS